MTGEKTVLPSACVGARRDAPTGCATDRWDATGAVGAHGLGASRCAPTRYSITERQWGVAVSIPPRAGFDKLSQRTALAVAEPVEAEPVEAMLNE